MKRVLFYLSAACLIGLSLSGCKKDKDDDPIDPFFTIDGVACDTLTWGEIFDYGEWADDYDGTGYCVYLYSNGMTYDDENGWGGSGDYIMFSVNSTTSGELATASYSYVAYPSSGDDPLPANSLTDNTYWVTGWNTDDYNYAYIYDGTVSIVNKGDQSYEIALDCTDSQGQAVKVYFSGSLDYYDYSKVYKSKRTSLGTQEPGLLMK